MMRHPLSRPVRPRLEPLEGREVPAGNVTATLVGGRLTLTGDDQANGLTLLVTPAAVTVTPDATTSINGQAPGTPAVLTGAAASLVANLAGGDDSLSIDNATDFALAGAATVNLGGGTNALNLTTSGTIALGSLAVTSGPGSNTVTVNPTGGGTVTGPASFVFGAGGSNQVTLTNTTFRGAAGVRVAVGSGGQNVVTATDVTVTRALTVNVGRSTATQTFANDTLGGLALTGAGPNVSINSTTINGNLSAIGDINAGVSANNLTVTGNVSVSGPNSGSFSTSGTSATINGNLSVTSRQQATAFVYISGGSGTGTFTARNVSVSGGQSAEFRDFGAAATMNGNLSVTSPQQATVFFENFGGTGGSGTGTATVRNVSVSGGQGSQFRNFGDAATISGNLTVTSQQQASVRVISFGGSGSGTLTARNVSVSGPQSSSFSAEGRSVAIDGNLAVTSRQQATADVYVFGGSGTGTVTARNVSVSGGTLGRFQFFGASAAISGNVSVTSPQQATVFLENFGGTGGSGTGTATARNVTVSGGQSSQFQNFGDAATISGNLAVTSPQQASASVQSFGGSGTGTATVRNVSVSGGQSGSFTASGQSVTIDGNLAVTSRQSPGITFQTSALSEVRGNVVEGGSTLDTSFRANGSFRADRNVTVTATPNSRSSSISIGDTGAGATIGGNLTVATGNGPLSLTLTNLTVGGATGITTGAGADTLTIDATTFKGAFTANTGAGDDTVNIAQQTGMPAPVTFGGRVTLNAGPDNDTLRLGLAPTSGGDANSAAVFDVPGSVLNGGAGLNTFFRSTSNFTGGPTFLNWTDA